jgi:hypothetical protein
VDGDPSAIRGGRARTRSRLLAAALAGGLFAAQAVTTDAPAQAIHRGDTPRIRRRVERWLP